MIVTLALPPCSPRVKLMPESYPYRNMTIAVLIFVEVMGSAASGVLSPVTIRGL